jgi:hypothetical protein
MPRLLPQASALGAKASSRGTRKREPVPTAVSTGRPDFNIV